MTFVATLLPFKLILVLGFSTWLAVIVLNNVLAFRNGVFAVGTMMSMAPFDEEPAIQTPLLARRVVASRWHRLVYGSVVALEAAVLALMMYAAFGLGSTIADQLAYEDALIRGNLAFAALLVLDFVFLIGGAWFVYYIRQDSVQIAHFALLGATLAGALVLNLPSGSSRAGPSSLPASPISSGDAAAIRQRT
ncbi:putative small integral membrane protein [Sphingomonas sp. UYAg733]